MSEMIQAHIRDALLRARDQGLIRHAYAARFDARTIEILAFTADDEMWDPARSWFDLASLTKAMCTAPLALHAIAEGQLSLTFEVGERFAGARTRGGRMLIWHLLCHAAGLRAYDHALPTDAALTTTGQRADFVARRIADWIEDAAGAETVYSDLGYVTLGVLLEAVYGGSLDRIFERWLVRHLSGLDLAFVLGATPTRGGEPIVDAVAVPNGASRDRPWQVHDPMAAYLGAVAGHAGLWGTGPAVTGWLQALLTQTNTLLTPGLAAYFLAKAPFFEQGSFTLGLDTAGSPSAAGTRHPADAVGHLGFTGCSFWYSPSQGSGSVLLTDRAAQFPAGVLTDVPAANRAALFALRQAIHGACWA